jgi:hypothetical protein
MIKLLAQMTKGHPMLDATKEVQGVALYAEFRKPGAMMQIFITPDGFSTDGKEVPASLYRRVITPSTPKKQWRNSNLSWKSISDLNGDSLPNEKRETFAESRLTFATQLFDGIKSGGWVLTKETLHIEISNKDLDDVRASKTPNKLLYRINQTRDALGFPAEVA